MHSEDFGSKARGGDLGWVKRGSLVNNFENTAFTLKINEISNPIETEFGFHILETLDKKQHYIYHLYLNLSKNTHLNNVIVEEKAVCPYCWESIYFEIDTSVSEQEYVEDCHVCCNPILLRVNFFGNSVNIETTKEDDGF